MKINTIVFILTIFFVLLLVGCSVPKACTQEAKICPDGSSVGRIGPNCEFPTCPESKLKINECNASQRGQSCEDGYNPVCAWYNQSIKCVKYPCAGTYANSCEACRDVKVAYWTEGPCPKTDAELQSACRDAGGDWLPDSKECVGISQEQCSILNGKFNECASACRNDPNATICTLQCVVVCQFKSS